MQASEVTLGAYFKDKAGQTHALISSPEINQGPFSRIRGQKLRHMAVYADKEKTRNHLFGKHDRQYLVGNRTFGKIFSTVSVHPKIVTSLNLEPLAHLKTKDALDATTFSILSKRQTWDTNNEGGPMDETTILLSSHVNDRVKLPCGSASAYIDDAYDIEVGAPVYTTQTDQKKLLGFVGEIEDRFIAIIPAHEFVKICNTDIQFMQPGMPG